MAKTLKEQQRANSAVACPTCKVGAGTPCVTKGMYGPESRQYTNTHKARYDAAEELAIDRQWGQEATDEARDARYDAGDLTDRDVETIIHDRAVGPEPEDDNGKA